MNSFTGTVANPTLNTFAVDFQRWIEDSPYWFRIDICNAVQKAIERVTGKPYAGITPDIKKYAYDYVRYGTRRKGELWFWNNEPLVMVSYTDRKIYPASA